MDAVSVREAAKYDAAWKDRGYRVKCHSLQLWKEHREVFPSALTSAIDLGCGTARIVPVWLNAGVDAYGVDLVPSRAVDTRIYVKHSERFYAASLWDFHPGRMFDLGVCTDVMEHIPPDRVMDALKCIGDCCRQCLFLIANFPSRFEGQTLHLTLRDGDWWRAALWAGLGGAVEPLPYRDVHGRAKYLFRWASCGS